VVTVRASLRGSTTEKEGKKKRVFLKIVVEPAPTWESRTGRKEGEGELERMAGRQPKEKRGPTTSMSRLCPRGKRGGEEKGEKKKGENAEQRVRVLFEKKVYLVVLVLSLFEENKKEKVLLFPSPPSPYSPGREEAEQPS